MSDEEKPPFVSSFVRAYLRKVQNSEQNVALSGVFEHDGHFYAWGAVVEYGPPPIGGLLVEMGLTDEETAHFRFWHGIRRAEAKVIRGRVMHHDEMPN